MLINATIFCLHCWLDHVNALLHQAITHVLLSCIQRFDWFYVSIFQETAIVIEFGRCLSSIVTHDFDTALWHLLLHCIRCLMVHGLMELDVPDLSQPQCFLVHTMDGFLLTILLRCKALGLNNVFNEPPWHRRFLQIVWSTSSLNCLMNCLPIMTP